MNLSTTFLTLNIWWR